MRRFCLLITRACEIRGGSSLEVKAAKMSMPWKSLLHLVLLCCDQHCPPPLNESDSVSMQSSLSL